MKFPEIPLPDLSLPSTKELLDGAVNQAVARVEEDYAAEVALTYAARELDPNREHAGCALVLEGGGMRGIFTAGVLDTLMAYELSHPQVPVFQSVWGVSAGAINACNYKARQLGRSMRVMLAFRDDKRFMSYSSFVRTGNIAGADFMYDEVQNRLDPMDSASFNANPLQMVAVATSVTYGTAAYLRVRELNRDIDYVRASASLPGFSEFVELEGKPYLDGGTADSVPFAAALGLTGAPAVSGLTPAQRAVCVLTRPRTYVKQATNDLMAARVKNYNRYPDFQYALYTRAQRYNAQRVQLWDLEQQGLAYVIAPSEPLGLRTTEKDGAPLLTAYLQGCKAAEQALPELLSFVAGAA